MSKTKRVDTRIEIYKDGSAQIFDPEGKPADPRIFNIDNPRCRCVGEKFGKLLSNSLLFPRSIRRIKLGVDINTPNVGYANIVSLRRGRDR